MLFGSSGRIVLPTLHLLTLTRNATKKAGGTVKNGRDSIGKRLGVKKFGGYVVFNCNTMSVTLSKCLSEQVAIGNIIVRQRGRTMDPGENVKLGRDYTIYAMTEGWVKFTYNKEKGKQVVSISNVNPHLPNMQKQQKLL